MAFNLKVSVVAEICRDDSNSVAKKTEVAVHILSVGGQHLGPSRSQPGKTWQRVIWQTWRDEIAEWHRKQGTDNLGCGLEYLLGLIQLEGKK